MTMMEITANLETVGLWMISHGFKILIVVILTMILLRVARIASTRIFASLQKRKDDGEFQKRTETLGTIVHYVLTITIIIVAVITALGEVGVEIGPVLAAAGVVGVAVGFGAQSLIKDVLSGFFIFLEDQIRVGDVVEIAGKSGLVERMNLKMTTLRDMNGSVHYIPNGQITVVTNMTKGYSRYVFDIGVAYREDVDEVIKVMQEIDEELRNDPDFMNDIMEPLEVLGLDQFADSALIIKARTMTKPMRQWRVGREFNRRLKKKFDEKNIEIPFPHVTVYLGQDKQGNSPPLHVTMQGKEQTRQ